MEIRIVNYKYDISKSADYDAYHKMCKKLENNGFEIFSCLATTADYRSDDMPEIQNLHPKHLWDNQFNTKEGFRVFDWYEPIFVNRSFKCGYYITVDTKVALDEFRKKFVKCGYCGCMEHDDGQILHRRCLGSEYLEEKDIHRCFFQPVLGKKRDYPNLPEYKDAYAIAQADAKIIRAKEQKKRLIAQGKQILKDATKKCQEIREEAKIKNEICQHSLDPHNLINYGKNGGWVFGWYKPMTQEQSEYIRSLPLTFNYTIKMQDGTTR